MAKVRAVVLAAGRGVRMGGERPKTLIPVGGGKPFLYYILHGLERAGVQDLLVITGHRSGDVAAYVQEHWGEEKVQFVFNARYASFGNFHSLRMAVDQSPGYDLLVVNSDIIISPHVYERVLGSDGDLVLAVEERYGLDEEDMRVSLKDGRVRAIGKEIRMALSDGEFCGVSLLRPDAGELYYEHASNVEWTDATGLYYEDLYARIIPRVDARAVPAERGEYAEVDVPADMPNAERVIERLRDAWPEPEPT